MNSYQLSVFGANWVYSARYWVHLDTIWVHSTARTECIWRKLSVFGAQLSLFGAWVYLAPSLNVFRANSSNSLQKQWNSRVPTEGIWRTSTNISKMFHKRTKTKGFLAKSKQICDVIRYSANVSIGWSLLSNKFLTLRVTPPAHRVQKQKKHVDRGRRHVG